jgi:hypothetical protein
LGDWGEIIDRFIVGGLKRRTSCDRFVPEAGRWRAPLRRELVGGKPRGELRERESMEPESRTLLVRDAACEVIYCSTRCPEKQHFVAG